MASTLLSRPESMGEKHDHDLLGEANGWEDDGSLEDVEETSEQPQPA